MFMAKAEEFVATAEDALEEGRNSSAAGNAVHAGINAADAILGARTGQRAAGQDHGQVVELIVAVPGVGRNAANRLRRLLPLKSKAEYDPTPISASDARRAVEQAQALVVVARRVVAERLGLDTPD